LDRFRGVDDPKDTPNGAEAWVGSMTRANGATADNPNLGCAEVILPDGTRKYLLDVVQENPLAVLGEAHMELYDSGLGMLIKMIDAKTPFLMQCHPTREQAAIDWNSKFGKEECWYVLGTRRDAGEQPYILLGFKEGITREVWEQAYRQGDVSALEDLCHKVIVHPGECYLIPGGVPHALGAGCFVAEIQEPSDLTAVPFPQSYLLDYRRKANPLGVFVPEDEALYEHRMLNAFRYEGYSYDRLLERLKSRERVLRRNGESREVEIFGEDDTDSFSCTIVHVCGSIPRKSTQDVQIGIVVEGAGELRCGDLSMQVRRGDEIFFPYQVEDTTFAGNFSIILCNPGMTAKYK